MWSYNVQKVVRYRQKSGRRPYRTCSCKYKVRLILEKSVYVKNRFARYLA